MRNAICLHSYYVPSGWNSNLQQPQPELASLTSTASQYARVFFTVSHQTITSPHGECPKRER